MKISHEKPEILPKLEEKFGVKWENGVVITYGDTVYTKDPIPAHIAAHEEVHIRQQAAAGGPEKWYERYLEDPAFRYHEELEAYCVQYRFIRTQIKDKNAQVRELMYLARLLSGPMYGCLHTQAEAAAAIRKGI